jgi:hypothetical protein
LAYQILPALMRSSGVVERYPTHRQLPAPALVMLWGVPDAVNAFVVIHHAMALINQRRSAIPQPA